MRHFPVAVYLVIAVATACIVPVAGHLVLAENESVKDSKAAGVVATEAKPANVQVSADSAGSGDALEVTARPVRGTAESSAYLVGVFVSGHQPGDATPTLLGTFSFFPARIGEAQTFVLPKQPGDMPLGKGATLSIKLIPANPARDIKDAAVEILGARVVK